MLKQISKVLILRSDKVCSRAISRYASEIISCQDKSLFPAEKGVIKKSLYGDEVLFPKCTIDQYVWENVNQWSDKTAVVCGVTGKLYTYAKLRDQCSIFAHKLRHIFHMNTGDVVGLCMPNMPEFVISALGTLESGLVLSTFNPIYTSHEISVQIMNSNTKLLICTSENCKTVLDAVTATKKDIKVICVRSEQGDSLISGTIDFDEIMSTNNEFYKPHSVPDYQNTAFLPYSSGTTGLPKGVCLTHRNIISNSEMISAKIGIESLALPTTATYQESIPCVLPFYHIYGWTVNLISKLRLGCKLITLPNFRPDTYLACLEQHKASCLTLVPPIVIFLGNFDGVQPKHVEHVRMVMSGAAPLGAKDAERFKAKATNTNFSQGYGLTECSPVALMQAIGNPNFASVGSPSPGTDAKIIALDDSDMVGLGPNESGELCVRGPHLMKGYLNNDKATNETIVNGWLRTGDIGYYDENDQFYLTDRLKELIKVKGFQVAPAELEALLRTHPMVQEAAVIGVPNEKTGEAPRGYIVAKPDKKINEQEILDYIAEHVAPYKRLESIVVTESIPKNTTGKILRRELKKKYGLL